MTRPLLPVSYRGVPIDAGRVFDLLAGDALWATVLKDGGFVFMVRSETIGDCASKSIWSFPIAATGPFYIAERPHSARIFTDDVEVEVRLAPRLEMG